MRDVIEKALKEYNDSQINLAAPAARDQLAKKIAMVLQRAFFVTPYSSQSEFE